MPKQKTNKALVKKLQKVSNGKAYRRATGQNHFNAKESGATTRAKRSDRTFAKADAKNIMRALGQ